MMLQRLFVAITLTDPTREAAAAIQARVRHALDQSALTWTRPEQLHITLVFLGSQADASAARVLDVMKDDLDEPPFDLALGGLGVFPPRGVPRVLWLGVARGGEAVAAVQRAVAARVAWLPLAEAARPFHAHVTLGRWRTGGIRERRRVEGLQALAPPTAPMRVDAVTTYHSRLQPSGSSHTALASARLVGH